MKHLLTFLTAMTLAICSYFPASACSCAMMPPLDSIQQLDGYDFIAHVKITGRKVIKDTAKNAHGDFAMLTIEIMELFKGERIREIREYSVNTSCELGIEDGQEALFFGRKKDGKIGISPCDRNQLYRKPDGQREWRVRPGGDDLTRLKKFYKHPFPAYKDKHVESYANGQQEIEEYYFDGKLTGERKIWYPNGVIYGTENYVNGKLDGKVSWYFPSGQMAEESFYNNGTPYNVSRSYYDSTVNQQWKKLLIADFYKTEDSFNLAYKRVQVRFEYIYDANGQTVAYREYSRMGRIQSEKAYDNIHKFVTSIYYHDNGNISEISYQLNGLAYGHYQRYDEDGNKVISWDYDEKGQRIKKE